MNHLKSTIIAIAMLAITEPWRAGFIMFLASPPSPLPSVSGEMSTRFVSKLACQKYIAGLKLDGGKINFFFEGRDYQAEIVGYELFCYEPLAGEGV